MMIIIIIIIIIIITIIMMMMMITITNNKSHFYSAVSNINALWNSLESNIKSLSSFVCLF